VKNNMDTEWIKEKAVLENGKRTLDIGPGKLEWPAQVIHHFRNFGRNYNKVEYCGEQDYTAIFDLELPPTALLQDSLDRLIRNETILIKAGFAFCHKNDQYCKKTGRELAKTKLEYYHFNVASIDRPYREDCTQIFLELSDINKSVSSSFKKIIGSVFTLKFYPNGRAVLC
jgi:hypothetical protein